MIYLKSLEEIELMRESAQLVSRTLGLLAAEIKPGVTTARLDKLAEEFIRDNGAEPGFKGYRGYPGTLCISINEQVVHGIPGNREIRDGDIVSIDCGVRKNEYFGDHAYSFPVGNVEEKYLRLLEVTRECLQKGIEQVEAGNTIGDIGAAVQIHAEENGFSVVRELVGHGIGKNMHEEPQIPNYGLPGSGARIKNGMVLAIEPMINYGKKRVKQLRDGWTVVTLDGLPSAHYEHDVAVIEGRAEVLSTFDYIYEALEKA